ncbi:peptide methionine sulfoxide reductase-like [Amblyomma americanum]
MFWDFHDPTACQKRQYMSAIFYHDNEQKAIAEESLKQHQDKIMRPIATKIVPAGVFYDAEDYHQKYLLRRHIELCESLKKAGLQDFKESHVAARLNGYCSGYGTLAAFEAERQQLGLSEAQAVFVRQFIE